MTDARRAERMTLGSLFSGIGGLDLGLERAGFVLQWQVEVDPYARGILERHWPGIHRRSDVRLCDATTLAPVDCIAGGFPCQDISSAGKGAGITGKRSGLWSEFARLVHELRPRWVLVENVPALRTRGADTVLGDLEAAGYACEAVVVGARHVGAAHRRDRVWIVAHAHGDGFQGERGDVPEDGDASPRDDPDGRRRPSVAHADRTGLARRSRQSGDPRTECPAAVRGGDAGVGDSVGEQLREPSGRRCGSCGSESPFAGSVYGEPHTWESPRTVAAVGRRVHGVSRRLARRHLALKALGNSVVPQVAEVLGRAMLVAASAQESPHD